MIQIEVWCFIIACVLSIYMFSFTWHFHHHLHNSPCLAIWNILALCVVWSMRKNPSSLVSVWKSKMKSCSQNWGAYLNFIHLSKIAWILKLSWPTIYITWYGIHLCDAITDRSSSLSASYIFISSVFLAMRQDDCFGFGS